jgi:two-component system NtrC family sensor kinase
MSLRTKFAILLALLALTISGSMAVALWSFGLQRAQLLGPYANTPEVIDQLRLVGVHVEAQAELLRVAGGGRRVGGSGAVPDDVEAPVGVEEARGLFEARSALTRESLGFLEAQGVMGMGGGTIASRTLAAKVEALQQQGAEALAKGDAPAMLAAAERASEVTTLVAGLNNRVVLECVRAIETVEAVRRKLLVSVVWAFLAAGLLGTLALFLVRRWVLSPVAELRRAAMRIAAGDFGHRVRTQGNDELAQLASDVNHMAGTIEGMLLERVERERLAAVGEMVRRLAHNLRNPLSGIRGLAELTRDEVAGQPELRDAQDRIIGSVDRFERWLADLLSVTKPLAVNPERAPVEPLLAGVLEAHRPMAWAKEITLELDAAGAPAEACFDARHLEHSLVAIVTNAIQASPSRATVRVVARVVEGGEEWEVRVADQGPGVAPDVVDKVFNAYFTTKKDGNGIGLAVAQQVVRAHGGRITIEPGVNGGVPTRGMGPGATFVVRMPIARAVAAGEGTGARG